MKAGNIKAAGYRHDADYCKEGNEKDSR